jgi:hypothetical protein
VTADDAVTRRGFAGGDLDNAAILGRFYPPGLPEPRSREGVITLGTVSRVTQCNQMEYPR